MTDELSGFIPISIDRVGARSVVRWMARPDASSLTPFFSQMTAAMLESGARQRITPTDALADARGRDPAGMVLHQSRCGSTLLMQSLAIAGCVAPVSEPTPVNQLLAWSDIPEQEKVQLLRGLVRALAPQSEAATELPYLIKLTSWNVLFVDVIRAAFPDTPWLFLYREPLEVLASQEQRPARWLSDAGFVTMLAHARKLSGARAMNREESVAAALTAYGEAALRASASCNLLNYNQLPDALSIDVPARFGVVTSNAQRARIVEASRFYSKDATRTVVFDPAAERRGQSLSVVLREADERFTRPVYVALEARRRGEEWDSETRSF
jgi:hypothetical protein